MHDDDDDEALGERWTQRQARLQALLESHGAAGLDFRVDLGKGRFWWQDGDGRPVVVAATRVLSSYALSDRSVLMGWANRSLPAEATVPAVTGVPERVDDCDEPDAWHWAMRVAEAVGCHFVYRAPNPQMWVFLALWDVRAAGAGDEAFEPGSPWPYVELVLESLVAGLDEGRDVRTLARNYGQTFVDDHLRKGTSLEAPLVAIGSRLAALGDAPTPDIRRELVALQDEVAHFDLD